MAAEGTAFHAKGEKNNLPHVGEDEELFVAHRIKAEILILALKAFLSQVPNYFLILFQVSFSSLMGFLETFFKKLILIGG